MTAVAVKFQQCEFCTYDLATGEGERGCHYYACPYLPEELDVTCPTCLYNFYTRDGNPDCGDPPNCAFALEEAPIRVDNMEAWLQARVHVTGQPAKPRRSRPTR